MRRHFCPPRPFTSLPLSTNAGGPHARKEETVRNYESVIIIRPGAAAEAELVAIIEKYSAIITNHGGEIAGIDRWGLKKLAYPIKKETQGVYILARYAATPEGILELERLLRIDDRIIKYLTVKLTAAGEPFALTDDDGKAEVAAEDADESDDQDNDDK